MTTDAAVSLRRIEREVLALLTRVRRTSAEHARLVHPELQTTGYAVLLHLIENEPTRAADIVEALGIDKGAVSRQVAQLEQLGLLARTCDPEDRRAQTLVLSDDGRARLAVLREQRRSDFGRRLSTWSAADLAIFAERLSQYNASLDGPPEQPPISVCQAGRR
jgi:DNA-binding MarR family transcriptional regulator